jgi:selenocysteine lyase/cysteine desulfurase
MLPSQRALFDIPREVCFLNAASWSPLPLATQEAGRAAVGRKGRPWTIAPEFAGEQHERARKAAARLINAEPDDVALISSISYGVATVGKMLALPRGSRVLVLQDDHSSPVLEWMGRAEEAGVTVETIAQPADGDWTGAILAAIERPGAPPVSLASISCVHWSDGCLVDLDQVGAALRRADAKLLVDATQAVGAMPMDVKQIDPDFLMFPTYKWTLGPYGRAFLYVAKRQQGGIPLEQTPSGRRAIAAERMPYLNDTRYVDNARRFDMGERDHFIGLEMAAIGMELVGGWGAALTERLRFLTDRLAAGLADTDVAIMPRDKRAPHLLCLAMPQGIPAELPARLAAENCHVALRLGRLRISPHGYNDEQDVDRFVDVFKRLRN